MFDDLLHLFPPLLPLGDRGDQFSVSGDKLVGHHGAHG